MADLKFDIDGKKLSSKDINAKKDFESFLKKVEEKGNYFNQKSWFWTTIGLASFTILTMLLFNNHNNNFLKEASNPTLKDQKKCLAHPVLNEYFFNDDLFHSSLASIFKAEKKVFANQIISVNPIIYNSLETKYNLIGGLNQKLERLYFTTKDSTQNYKLRNIQNQKITKIDKSKIIIPDNLVELELQKTPRYQKISKKRIHIQH